MLSRKNKDLRTIKEGVVGKYVKKETPPEMPSKLLLLLQIIFEKTTILHHCPISVFFSFNIFSTFQLFSIVYLLPWHYEIQYIFSLFFLQLLLTFSY